MGVFNIILIAIGLSFDTFAVSLSCGVAQSKILFRQAARVAAIMALFQGGLPVLGFYLGSTISNYVELIDHWLAFSLLSILGIRMIIEGFKKRDRLRKINITRMSVLITMAIGTSIDAFTVGISFGLLQAGIWFEALTIGLVTFLASMIAIRIGKAAGKMLGRTVEIIGGLLLFGIGIKILLEHTIFS